MAKLDLIEGIGSEYLTKFMAIGILKVEELLERGATPAGRKNLEERTGISHKLILEWVNHADLFRIKGIGEEFADLLEEAGVDTVPELAQRDPVHLYIIMVQMNNEKKLVRRMPSTRQVVSWVEQAKSLPRVINY
jgi:predicted flap endonuclease-1-like 5' DNA nuclease